MCGIELSMFLRKFCAEKVNEKDPTNLVVSGRNWYNFFYLECSDVNRNTVFYNVIFNLKYRYFRYLEKYKSLI